MSSRLYYPQIPVDPDHFAGRKEILNEVQKTIKSTEEGRSENFAISGIRGIGKTSLVFKLKELVPDTCFLAYYVPSKEVNTQEFVDTLLQKMDLQYQKGLGKYKRLLEKAKQFPGKVESFSVEGVGVSLREGKKTPEIAFMEAISKFIQRGFKAVILQIDEADLLTDEVLAMIRNCVQELQSPSYACPVSIIVSGRENLLKRLTGKLSPISRFFSTHSYELKSLTKEEVAEALTLPAKSKKIKWNDYAIELVYDLSKGYPFIVQIFGHYSVISSNGKEITKENVEQVISDVIAEVGVWYEASWSKDPSPQEIKVLLTLGILNGRSTFTNISKKFGGKGVGELLKRLVEKGCLEKDESNNEYYLPHPLVIDYLKIKYAKTKVNKN